METASDVPATPDEWEMRIDELLARPPLDHSPDASWLSVVGFYLFLPLNLPAALVVALSDTAFRAISAVVRYSCAHGRPLWLAWAMWWYQPAAAILLLVKAKKSRFAFFSLERQIFGGGDWWWHGEGAWSCPYAQVRATMASAQTRAPAFGASTTCCPELFPPRNLLFLDGTEWAAVRGVIEAHLTSDSNWHSRLQKLPAVLGAALPTPFGFASASKSLCDRLVATAIWYMLFGVELNAEEAEVAAQWGASGLAGYFIFPRLIHRVAFNALLRRVLSLRRKTLRIVSAHQLQPLFERMNAELPDEYRRPSALELCDEVMYAVNFAGVGGTQHATWAVCQFLQRQTVDVPPSSVRFPPHASTLIQLYQHSPDDFIKEAVRLDAPVTSATCVFAEEQTVAFKGVASCARSSAHRLPKGTLHQYVLSIANRDPAQFALPNHFDPCRANLDDMVGWNGALNNKAAYPRICPGQALSLEVVKAIVGSLDEVNAQVSRTDWPVRQPPTKRKADLRMGCCKALGLLLLSLLLAAPAYLCGGAVLVASHTLFGLLAPLLLFVFMYLESFLPHNDWYTKVLLLSYQALFFSRRQPTAKDMRVELLAPKRRLRKRRIAYAINLQVPLGAEEDFTSQGGLNFSGGVATIVEENLHRLPNRVRTGTQAGVFGASEDPVAYAMRQVGGIYPVVNQPWEEKTSDAALARFCLHGLGAHRIEVVEEEGQRRFVVRTNALADLPVHEGLETYGGDAYFDEEWRPLKIVRKEPAQAGETAQQRSASPGEPLWDYFKFCFRSSLFALVTLVDHLYGIHMQIGNIVVTASREQLSAEHPIRRFLAVYCYQTISVNDNARTNLINPDSIGPRNFAFTEAGMQLAWVAAPALLAQGSYMDPSQPQSVFDRELQLANKRQAGIDTAYNQQALEYWQITKRFVEGYLRHYFPTDQSLCDDAEANGFLRQMLQDFELLPSYKINSLAEAVESMPAADRWQLMLNLITRYCDLVTAGHEHVGQVNVYAQDVSFCAFRWEKGAMVGSKQTAVTQSLLMSFTSTPMPKLVAAPGSDGDWTHIFLKDPRTGKTPSELTELYAAYQADLRAFSARCDAYNDAAASRPYPNCYELHCFNPKHLETSVSV